MRHRAFFLCRPVSSRLKAARRTRLALESLEPRRLLEAAPLITEFMADNDSTLADGDDNFPDWIEIYNPADVPVSLHGWYLTDDADDLEKWEFPQVTIDAGEYLLVFASGQNVDDYVDGQGYLHTNFKLDADGGSLALVASDGHTVVDAYWDYPGQLRDVSYGVANEVLVSAGATAQVWIPEDDSLGTAWTGLEFTPGPGWLEGPTGIGYDVHSGGGEPTPALRVDFSRSGTPGPTQAGWEPLEHDGTASITWALPNDELAGVGNSVDVTIEGQTHWRDYAAATGSFAPLSNLLSDGPLCNAPSTMTLRLENLLDGIYQITTYHHTTQFGPSARPPATPFDIYLTDSVVTNEAIVIGAVMSDNNSASLSTQTIEFTVLGGSAVEIDFVRGESVGEPDHFALPGFELALLAEVGVGHFVATDIEAEMHDENASAYLRIPFEAEDVANLGRLKLRAKYDDGLVAYLNGVPVASRNAPPALTWDSAAAEEHPVEEAIVFEDIPLSDFAYLLQPGTNVLAIHGLNLSPDDEDFLILPELIAANLAGPRYMTVATPGAENAEGYLGLVADTRFSVERGFYDEPFQLELATDTPGAEIRYTTDGSEPTETRGTVYTDPIVVDGLSVLRAASFKPDYIPSKVNTHTYLFLEDVVVQDGVAFPTGWGIGADYAMEDDPADLARIAGDPGYTVEEARGVVADSLLSLPTLSIVMDTDDVFGPQGIYTNTEGRGLAWERPTSVELIYADGSSGFQENAGIRIQGFTSRDPARNPKHSLRLVFRNQYGAGKLEYPFFGDSATDEFDTIILRSNAQDAWVYNIESNRVGTFARDQWLHETQQAMGQPAVSANYVHLYINGLYWGVYNPTERPDASFGASYFGGEKGDYDALKNHEEVIDGTGDAYFQLLTLIQNDPNNFSAGYRDLSSDEAYRAVLEYVDVDNLADYMIHNMYAATTDWPGNNYIVRNRMTGEGFMFLDWDGEHAFKTGVTTNRTVAHSRDQDSPTKFHHALRSNAEYRMLFADHLYRAFSEGGALYVNPEHPQWDPDHPEWNVPAARWMAIAGTIDQALIAESARWGDYADDFYGVGQLYTPHDQLLSVRNDLLTNWFPQRSQIVLAQFRAQGMYPNINPPVFEINGEPQHGGDVPAGFALELLASVGEVYYTLDGRDPRLPGGGVGGTLYTGPITLDESVLVRVRALSGDEWSALDEAEFHVEGLPIASGLVVTELSYNPSVPTAAEQAQGITDNDDFEFIELRNTSDKTLPLTGVHFSKGIAFQFTTNYEGSAILITEAGTGSPDFIEIQNVSNMAVDTSGWVVAANDATNSRIGDVHSILWALPGSMAAGELLYRPDTAEDNIYWSTDGDGWVMILDDQGQVADFVVWGYSISEIDSLEVDINGFEDIRVGAAWSGLAVPAGGSGFPANSLQRGGESDHDNASDWAFKSPQSVDMEHEEGIQNDGLSVPFAGVSPELAPGEFAVIARNAATFAVRYGSGIVLAGQYTGKLDNGGEQIVLVGPGGQAILEFTYGDSNDKGWPQRPDGGGSSLEVIDPYGDYDDPDNWRASIQWGGTPGEVAIEPSVVINEVLSHTDYPLVDAIELHNLSEEAIDIGGWWLSDSDADYQKFQIPPGTTISGGGYVVFYEGHYGFDGQDWVVQFGVDEFGGGVKGFGLNGAEGDEVYLTVYDSDEHPACFFDDVEFGAGLNGESFGRWENSVGESYFYPMTERTLDPPTANSGPRIGPELILSEVMYCPPDPDGEGGIDPDDLEFVEIYNRSPQAVTLTDWRLRKGIDFDFPGGTALESGEALVVVWFDPVAEPGKESCFRAHYEIDESVQIIGGHSDRLDNAGELVQLQDWDTPTQVGDPPQQMIPHPLEDEVDYETTWYASTAGGGGSLNRLGSSLWGDDPASWTATTPSPGVVQMVAQVGGRYVFYNNSSFDTGPGKTAGDAKATDKQALLPGAAASYANYTNYVLGINGILIDAFDLKNASGISVSDFTFKVGNDDNPATWAPLTTMPTIDVRQGVGESHSDRVVLTWPDGTIQNQWLEVTMKASGTTGLAAPEVFYFGNAIGETGDEPTTSARVNATDILLTRNNPHPFFDPADIYCVYDFNRDERVDAYDILIVRNNQTTYVDELNLIDLSGSKTSWPPTRPDTTEKAPADSRTSAHDAVLERTVPREWNRPTHPRSPMDWLWQFDSVGARDRPAKSIEPAERAVDQLLATFWP
ncbi:MAG: hypothetical protein A2V70_02015 [Planctomycetes bacterium RBG_13_63_9]|nr:MAG: hypothetical protein A2V70_02015 [Planctomycetes bacterium RBG_13_63_9]